MPSLEDVLSISKRNFLMIAHRARSDGKIHLNDLCGISGRWDGVARSITSALFLSHDMRRDTSIHILLLGPEDPPKLLSLNGAFIKYLNPDERASSALMKKCLKEELPPTHGSMIRPSPGVTITRSSLEEIINTLTGPIYYLHENGIPAEQQLGSFSGGKPINFILSDDMDLEENEESIIGEESTKTISLGPVILHTHMAIVVIHHLLDMAESTP